MDILSIAKESLNIELDALNSFTTRLDNSFSESVTLLNKCEGNVVVIGIGKSGLIGMKIAATLTSTGTPAVFIHAAEAIHGDLGGISKDDVAIVLSNSGETTEICTLLPYLKKLNLPIVAITGRPDSSLGKSANAVINSNVDREADSMNMAPTASTTVMLAAGDALACALMQLRKFTKKEYSKLHPGGSLGQKLMCSIQELMHMDDDMPVCNQDITVREAIIQITTKRLGCILVVNDQNLLIGIVTDGDLRRAFQQDEHPLEHPVNDIMTHAPKCAEQEWLAVDALQFMEDNMIMILPVTNEKHIPTGILHMHDLVRAGIK